MKISGSWTVATLAALLVTTACGRAPAPAAGESPERDSLAGAWRAQVRFDRGPLAEAKDLEFMYVFNAGGTLTESSNYDGAPPVPPAYGVWKKTGPRRFTAKYAFFITKAPGAFDDIAKGGGWSPSGYGVITEAMTLSEDGGSYTSTLSYVPFDSAGKPVDGGGTATGAGARMSF